MKKLIILLTILMSVLINARTFTQEEKKEMVKQFSVFQQALENKDIKTIIAMTELPTKELTALITDEMGNMPEEFE